MPNDSARLKALLSDLGRATLRGVRKCPKCGTYNGTRGVCCKNKACNVVFKEAGEKRKLSTEACKLVTGTTTQVYSVRVRDKGPDYRGFVQLPVVQHATETDSSLENEVNLITQTSALCFVDTCQRSFDASVLKCHEKSDTVTLTTCQHIRAAMRCFTEAVPLTLKDSVLAALNISNEIKEAVWFLANESAGPLVQRVSKNIMAVKCKASPKHPLGYLHFSFFMSRLKDRVENKYFCSCTAFKGQVKHANNKDDPTFKRCVHFYACICAFASDPKLSDEFSYYINLDKPLVIPTSLTSSDEDCNNQMVTILASGVPCEVEVQVLRNDATLLDASSIPVSDDTLAEVHSLDVLQSDPVEVQIRDIDAVGELTFTETSLLGDTTAPLEVLTVKRKREEQSTLLALVDQPPRITESCGNTVSGSNINTVSSREIGCNTTNRRGSAPKIQQPRKQTTEITDHIDETTTSFSFTQWLASVTERINQTMHFQFDGRPDPLVFHIPQNFFDCLRERISCGSRKKRLPNSTTAFIRRHSVPIGTFTKYTWNITNIIQVKQIFETSLMPLEITRSFIQNRDGSYEPYRHKSDENEIYRKTNCQPLIKPLELKTFLKVGNTAPDQTDPTPFVIEWIPNILPESSIGELRIRFEFGHQRNGQVEKHLQLRQTYSRLESRLNDDISITRVDDCGLLPM
ncbi:uncharacterized protein C2orf42 homolog isoform X2 [Schistocerca gregaria]|uniref:uncharacterized protein C2orf42 homolog isoform X2 n=1 Tax=Schistocerca gregaria TaxID=7010 RepID=UPI00211EDAC2|nr:uncharacterized protein C2orf42 homolog isoform X2 [Schistocerca gregaria]XP_049859147.1 uncharacterized protein C2orf42 homolog isoform X2 [Schistocerca gregaria]